MTDVHDLPEDIRLKLDKNSAEVLWQRLQAKGIKKFCEKEGFSQSKVYNWKNKEVYIPKDFVKAVLNDDLNGRIKGFKGPGRSKAVENPDLPLNIPDELLTRIESSVSVNNKGTPMYRTGDRGNLDRFIDLLQNIGDVPYKVYFRDGFYQLSFPGFLYRLFSRTDYETSLADLIDEEGEIQGEVIQVDDREISLEEFNGKLFHTDKRFRLALANGDKDTIHEIMAEEAEKAREAVY